MKYPVRKRTDLIVVHCTATKEGQKFTAKDVDRMHRQRGFNGIGYHFVILLDGTVEGGRPVDAIGAHVADFNSTSVGISYVGGLDKEGKAKDTRTSKQKEAMRQLLIELCKKYPEARVVGHRDLSPDKNKNGRVDPHERIKECPCFDAIPEYGSYQALFQTGDIHTVLAGETAFSISRRYGLTLGDLTRLNPGVDIAHLKVGQTLRV